MAFIQGTTTKGYTPTIRRPTLAEQAKDKKKTTTAIYEPITTTSVYKPVTNKPIDLTAYSNDYQAEINRRKAINPNDPTLPGLTKLREEKIINQGPTIYSADQLETKLPLVALPAQPVEEPVQNAKEDYYADYLKNAQEEATRAQQQRINAALEANNAYIPKVNEESDRQLQEAYIASQRSKMNAPQALNAMGYTGGAAESSLLALDATYQNNRNALEANRNDTLGQIRQNANQIQTSGNADLAELSANYYNQMAQRQAQVQQQAQAQSNWDKQYQTQQSESEKADFLNSIGAYSADYMAQYNKVKSDGNTSNDWQLPYLLQARNDKLDSVPQLTAQQTTQSPYTARVEDNVPTLNTAKVNNEINSLSRYMVSGSTQEAASAIIYKYQNGSLTKAEANYILNQFGLPTIS